jgi:hypothetical protein
MVRRRFPATVGSSIKSRALLTGRRFRSNRLRVSPTKRWPRSAMSPLEGQQVSLARGANRSRTGHDAAASQRNTGVPRRVGAAPLRQATDPASAGPGCNSHIACVSSAPDRRLGVAHSGSRRPFLARCLPHAGGAGVPGRAPPRSHLSSAHPCGIRLGEQVADVLGELVGRERFEEECCGRFGFGRAV